jgi:hypothetical protein
LQRPTELLSATTANIPDEALLGSRATLLMGKISQEMQEIQEKVKNAVATMTLTLQNLRP